MCILSGDRSNRKNAREIELFAVKARFQVHYSKTLFNDGAVGPH